MRPIDHTHEPNRTSWVQSANEEGVDFPIQNLPLGVIQRRSPARSSGETQQPQSATSSTSDSANDGRSIAVAIGQCALDLGGCVEAGLFDEGFSDRDRRDLKASQLNRLMAWSVDQRLRLRHRIFELLADAPNPLRDNSQLRQQLLIEQTGFDAVMPCQVLDYTDFYASLFHATNVGSMFRPQNPLLPNYKHIPIGYHGRASSVVVSGTPVARPRGQTEPKGEGEPPGFGPSQMLDYELEVGAFIAQGNQLGEPIPIERAEEHLFGLCLLNDWSARDIQRWEYQPLGPFLAKSFATTISPWIVTFEALAPFRVPSFKRAAEDPVPLPYLTHESDQQRGGIDLTLTVHLQSHEMKQQMIDPMRISQSQFRDLYWTFAQMVTHHSSNGCNMQPGDLLGSGTVSGPMRSARGCLLELTWDGEYGAPVEASKRTPIKLPTGQQRRFLDDGDTVTLGGWCEAAGYRRIGLGHCTATIVAGRE